MAASLGLLMGFPFAARAFDSGAGGATPSGLGSVLAPGFAPTVTIPLPARRPPAAPSATSGSEPSQHTPAPHPALPHAPAPPPQSAWSEAEIAGAERRCRQIIAATRAVAQPLPSLKQGDCGTPLPVELSAFGANPQVVVFPPVTVNCEMIEALDGWMKTRLQPLAKREFGSPIVQLRSMSSYSCRNAIGYGKRGLSEHARANAVDIAGFVLGNGETFSVEPGWGPIARVVRWREKEAEKQAAERERYIKAVPKLPPIAANPLPGGLFVNGIQANGLTGTGHLANGMRDTTAARELTPSAPNSGLAAYRAANALPPVQMPPLDHAARFLREVHASACGPFSTILGPEANDYHKNHFHVDLAERKSGAFCQ